MSMSPSMVKCMTVLEQISVWVATKKDAILRHFLQKGGWEQWAQAEIADVLTEKIPSAAIQREQHIFKNNDQEVDILVTDGDWDFCIELKCESLFKSATQGRQTIVHTFYKDVLDDIEKLKVGRKMGYAKQPAAVVAITISQEAREGLIPISSMHRVHYLDDGWEVAVHIIMVDASWS